VLKASGLFINNTESLWSCIVLLCLDVINKMPLYAAIREIFLSFLLVMILLCHKIALLIPTDVSQVI